MEVKEIKEAIMFLEDVKREYTVCPTRYEPMIKRYDSVISLLQQGEKYKQMWEELEGIFEPGRAIEIPIEKSGTMDVDYLCKELRTLNYMIKLLKQKYFPKVVK